MKKILLLCTIILCAYHFAIAQLNYTSYNAQNIAGTYTDLGTSGTVITTVNKDDANSSAQNIGFTFSFNGQNFTQFILNTNGFIKLGNTPPSAANLFFTTADGYAGGIFNSTLAADINLLSPFNHDLIAISPASGYRVLTSGSSPSRICTIQFKSVRDKTTLPYVQFDSLDFQIKLYETTNVIEFIYGQQHSSADSSRFKSSACGLKGNVGVTTNQLLTVTKGSTQTYDGASFIDGNYVGNAFNFGNDNPGNGTGVNGSRPIVDPGRTLRFIPAFNFDMGVDLILAQGELPIPYGLPHTYRARISNVGLNTVTNFYVKMQVTGANTFSDSIFFSSFVTGAPQLVTFSGYTPQNIGVDNIRISITPDNYNVNNVLNYRQEVSRKKDSHVDTTKASNGIVGYNAGFGGHFLHRYHITGKRKITKTSAFISNEPTNIGNIVYGVVVDIGGTLIGRSADYVIQPSDLNKWKDFIIDRDPLVPSNRISPPIVNNADVYVGMYASASGIRYNPVGHIAENPLRVTTFYFQGTGGLITDYNPTLPYKSFLRAELDGKNLSIESVNITNPACLNPNKTVEVVIKNKDSAVVDFSVDTLFLDIFSTGAVTQSFSSVISAGTMQPNATQTFTITNNFDLGTSGTYNVELNANTWLEVDTLDNVRNMNVQVISTPGVNLVVNPDSVICHGVPFTFIAQPFTAGSRQYQWKINGVNSGGLTTDSSFKPTLTWGDTVSVDLITDHCTTTPFTIPSNEIVMKINPKPKLISGLMQETIRENTTKSYAIGLTPGSTYLWRATGGTMPDSTSTAVTVTWGFANPNGSLTCTEKDNKNCSYTHVLPVNITSIAGITEHGDPQLGQAYPNPADQSVVIPVRLAGSQEIRLALFDITGKEALEIYRGTASNEMLFEVNLGTLNDGLYFYRLQTAEGFQAVRKLTISKQ